jgi:aspartyl-tRNA(Asn)/glutamyl-tRNA(Gln) amidotransferase subunit B
MLDEVMNEDPDVVTQIMGGMTKSVDFLIGQIMRRTEGKAGPKITRELINEKFLSHVIN